MLSRESLEAMLAEGHSLEEIGRRVARHPSTVSYWLKKHGLEAPRRAKHAARGPIDESSLRALVDRGMSVRVIADSLGRSPTSIRHWLDRHGLKTARARHLRSADVGERFLAECSTHGMTTFQLRADGARRCLKCRSEAVVRRRRLVKSVLVAEAGGCCVLCGYDRYVGALEFHHVDPATKEFSLGYTGVTRSLDKARAEAAKCILLCATCHAEVEGGVATIGAARHHSRVAHSGVAQLAAALDC